MFRRSVKRKRKQRSALSPRMILIRQIVIGVLLFSVVGTVLYGVYKLVRIPSLNITDIEVVGGETISHEQVKGVVANELTGAYWNFVPRTFAYTYPHDAIMSAVATLPRLKNVHVERTDRRTVAVAFEEYRPVALWCKDAADRHCVFLDHIGYAFAAAPDLEGGAFVRYVEIGREPKVGEQAFSADFIADTNLFTEQAYDALQLNITEVVKTANDELEYQVAGGGVIKVSTRLTTDETLKNLESILTSAEFEHLEPGNFNYIDLRYGNKVFVNEVTKEVATTTEEIE